DRISQALGRSLDRLSSGRRINSAADGAADLAIAERFRAEIRSLTQAQSNTGQGIALAQVADSALEETGELLIRMRELAVQSANGTLGSSERASLEQEFASLRDEIDRIANTTEFNGKNPLADGSDVAIQVGPDAGDTLTVSGATATAAELGVDGLAIGTASGATGALSGLDTAIRQVSSLRSQFGTAQVRLESAARLLGAQLEGTSRAESLIRDVDVAQEVATLTRLQILQEAGVAALAQSNQNLGLLLKLL
ncbi:MAG: flagellin FliC, partial [Myxococcales bacterium]|nr:flagellin FliC [Myxococcales bacterium]